MDGGRWWNGVGIAIPAEEGAEAEVLDDGEFGEDFCVVHFDHSLEVFSSIGLSVHVFGRGGYLINLRPPSPNPRNIK